MKKHTQEIMESGKVKRKVAIVGYAPSSRDKAPYDDPSFEIWGVNELYLLAPRITAMFELHDYHWLSSKERNKNHLDWLRKTNLPVYMIKKYEDIPNAVEFPINEIREYFGNDFGRYFTNSISYMIGLAIMIGVDELHVYGVDMATHEEYLHQRPSVEAFLGYAAGRGIKVYIPAECDLLKTRWQYGYDDFQITEAAKKIKARKEELTTRCNQYRQAADQQMASFYQMQGALDDTNYWDRCWQGIDATEYLKE